MHEVNEIELWRERHEALIREAETERLARRLRWERSKRTSRLGTLLLGSVRESARSHLPRRPRA